MSYTLRTAAQAARATITETWGSLNWLASKPIGNAEGVTLGRVIVHPGCANPRHLHHSSEEVLYLLRGRLEHTMGDDTVILEAGDTLVVGAHVPHQAVNIGEADAEMIVAYPTGLRDFVPAPK